MTGAPTTVPVESNSLWRWWLDVDRIPADTPPGSLEFAFEHAIPPWAWALVVVAAAAVAWIAYARFDASSVGRLALGALRAATLVWVVVLLAGPTLVLPRERTERDRVVMLVDRSASLLVADGEDGATREDRLRELLESSSEPIAEIESQHDLLWFGFDEEAFDLRTVSGDSDGVPDLGEASGSRTRLGWAIEMALDRAGGRPISGIVVVSDGRSSEPIDPAILRRLEREGVAVFTFPLGSRRSLGDLAVGEVEVPRRAFLDDEVPVIVDLETRGTAPDGPVEIRLVDDATGEVLATEVATPDRLEEPVRLLARSPGPGSRRWRVEVDAPAGDLVQENDRRLVSIEIVDRPLRVLYVDGYPRWEYRYLKNLLVREKSVEVSVMLVSADRDFAQEGDRPIARLPRSPEEFADYDLIVVGDVPANHFSPDQLETIRDMVATRGTGLLILGGPRHTPASWEDTPLAELAPFGGGLALPTIGREVRAMAEVDASGPGLGVWPSEGDGSWPEEIGDPESDWAGLRWVQRIDEDALKPATEVLVATEEGEPILLRMRYGSGRVCYLATDETWRWRYGRGEGLQERFWIPLLRSLGRESMANDDQPVRLMAQPNVAALGEVVRVEVELLESRGLGLELPTVSVEIESRDGVERIDLPATGGGLYAGSWRPRITGRHDLSIDEPELEPLGSRSARDEVEVEPPDAEWRRPDADHETLESIAQATGGGTSPPTTEGFASLPDRLPNLSVTISMPLVERIWSSPLALLVAVLLLGMEWVGRRALRLA